MFVRLAIMQNPMQQNPGKPVPVEGMRCQRGAVQFLPCRQTCGSMRLGGSHRSRVHIWRELGKVCEYRQWHSFEQLLCKAVVELATALLDPDFATKS